MNDNELTLKQAADVLNASGEWVAEVIRARAIPYRMIDERPLVMLSDVTRYKSEIEAKRRDVLDELVAEAQDMGFYESR